MYQSSIISKIFLSFIALFSGKILQLTVKFILSLFVAKVLGPSQYGFWSMIELINKYSPLLMYGVANGVKRELPFWQGRNDKRKQQLTESSGYIGIAISTIIFATLSVIAFIYFDNELTKYAVSATFLSGGISQVYLYIYSLSLAKKKFSTDSN